MQENFTEIRKLYKKKFGRRPNPKFTKEKILQELESDREAILRELKSDIELPPIQPEKSIPLSSTEQAVPPNNLTVPPLTQPSFNQQPFDNSMMMMNMMQWFMEMMKQNQEINAKILEKISTPVEEPKKNVSELLSKIWEGGWYRKVVYKVESYAGESEWQPYFNDTSMQFDSKQEADEYWIKNFWLNKYRLNAIGFMTNDPKEKINPQSHIIR